MAKCKAIGNQGNWFAAVTAPKHPEVDGQMLPCIWDYWVQGATRYYDPGLAPDHPKAGPIVDALRNKKFAVMRKRKKTDDPNVWQSAGYIAIYEIENVRFGSVLEFDLIRRVCDLG